jgi:hypothetical protein
MNITFNCTFVGDKVVPTVIVSGILLFCTEISRHYCVTTLLSVKLFNRDDGC